MKPSPAEATKGGSVDASDIERTKSAKAGVPQPTLQTGSAGNKSLDQVAKFQEPDTSPGDQKWSPPPYASNNASDQQAMKKEEETLNKPSLVFTAHQQGIAQRGDGRVAAGWRKQA
jgi:hypothetical protein